MWKWSDLKRILFRKAGIRDTADLGAVMWPVDYPADIDPAYVSQNPHVTVVMFTDINNEDLGFTHEDVLDAVREVQSDVMLWLTIDGLEWFGEEQNVPVLLTHHDYLFTYRDKVMAELAKRGIPVDMTFPDYRPHISIPDAAALDEVWPTQVLAGPVEVWWGNVHYNLNGEIVGNG